MKLSKRLKAGEEYLCIHFYIEVFYYIMLIPEGGNTIWKNDS